MPNAIASSTDASPIPLGAWTLREIVKDRIFLIPDYQRGYAWTNRQLVEFWDDLEETEGARHYMGSIVVERNGDVFEVVDGQQRLTTLALLLSVLGSSPVALLRYGESSADREMLEVLLSSGLLPSGAEREFDPAPQNAYQRNLLDAKAFFSDKTRDWDESHRATLLTKCLDCLSFDFSALGEDLDCGIVFETINNRGKPLTLLEKLKNRLMYLAKFAAKRNVSAADDPEDEEEDEIENETRMIAEATRKHIRDTWSTIYHELAADSEGKALDEDEFAAAHLSLYRCPKNKVFSPVEAESRLFKMFCKNPEEHPLSEETDESDEAAVETARQTGKMEPELTIQKIKEYIDDLAKFAPAWAEIHQEFDSACGRCRLLSDTREVKAFLASVLRNAPDATVRNSIYDRAERLLFRGTIDAGVDVSRFATWARQLHGKCIGQLRRRDRRQLDEDGLADELQRLLDEKKPSAASVLDYFKNTEEGDFYGWSQTGLRYFLMKHEESVEHPRLSWNRFQDTSIEHVLPQSATRPNSRGEFWWRRVLADFVGQVLPTASEEVRKDACEHLVDTLGNLVLLTKEENAQVSNRAWESYPNNPENGDYLRPGKREFYRSEDKTSSSGALALANNVESWNAWQIRERGRRLFRELLKDFDVPENDVFALSDSDLDVALGFPAGDGVRLLENLEIPRLSDEEARHRTREEEEEDRTGFRRPFEAADIRAFLENPENRKYLCIASGSRGQKVHIHLRSGGGIRFLVWAVERKMEWRNRFMAFKEWGLRPEIPPGGRGNDNCGNVIQFIVPGQDWNRGQTDAETIRAYGSSLLDKLDEFGFFA